MQFEAKLTRGQSTNPSCLENLQSYFAEYCTNTSIHGLKFLGEKRRSLIERIWWLIFLVVSLYFCVTLILEAYQKWELSPVVVSFATSETAIFRIPFPAVTICPQIKSQRSLVNFTKLALKKRNGHTLTRKEYKDLEYMSLICSSKWRPFKENNLDPIINGDNVIDFLIKVQPDFYNTVEECSWLGKNCSEDINNIFTPILTKEGICFSYNLLDRNEIFTDQVANDFYERFAIPHQPRSEWSLEKGYEDGSGLDAFPRRTVIGGTHGGLDLTLYVNTSDLDYLCGDGLQGYKVILHNPIQIPYTKQRYFWVGLNQDVMVAVKPNIITTSKQLRHYSPLQRKCFFAEERKLRFFKIYDQQNCLHECLSNFSYKSCGCVGFFMLHDNSTPICGPGMQSCMEEASSMFLTTEMKSRIKVNIDRAIKRNRFPKELLKNCNCIPTCNSLKFDAEISPSEWNWKEGAKVLASNRLDLVNSNQLSRLQIFFKDMQFISSERNELYGKMDFFASCGGLLGLFIGFSFISIVEILYYVSLRFVCNFRKYGKRNWSGGDELLEVKADV